MLSQKTVWALGHLGKNAFSRTLMVSASRLQQLTVPEAYTPENLPLELKEQIYPKIGNRDIVGGGMCGTPGYVDLKDYPMPAVRWAANTAEVLALREKEKGDWKSLTLEEKKQLYRNSYRQTFAEIEAPTGAWKRIVAYVMYGLGASILLVVYNYLYVFKSTPSTLNSEHTQVMLTQMLRQNQGPITGISSKYDFEKGAWK